MRPPRIMITAGEASGDRLGAGLAQALRRRCPDLELIGMGGERMAAAGVRIVQNSAEVAVSGIFEVLKHLPTLRRAMGRLRAVLDEERPDLLVPVDFPDFNLRLAQQARSRGIPVIYFVSPQVWAWRRGRIHGIGRLVQRMLVLFPFEVATYREAGIPVTFVGHPLAEDPTGPRFDEMAFRAQSGFSRDAPIVCLAPGSRQGELERHLELLLATARRLQRQRPDVQFLLPVAPGLDRAPIQARADAAGIAGLKLHGHGFPEILGACAAGAVAAGTASLEAAVVGLPLVVFYRMNRLTYLLGRALVRIDRVALPNLVAGREVVPELIQGDCTPERLADALGAYLDDPARAEAVRAELREVRQKLGSPGMFERAAEAVLGELGR